MDIDRIMKETKTTTTTEARETIYFRPREVSLRRDASPSALDIPVEVKRLSIMDSQTDKKRVQPEHPSSGQIVDGDVAAKKQKSTDSVDELVTNCDILENELKSLNDKNKELRRTFFGIKDETPILSTSSPPPMVSAGQEWNCSSSTTLQPLKREKKQLSFMSPPSESKEGDSPIVEISPSQKKRNDNVFNSTK
ncbi:hypothetical protein DICVIV_13628 [Dictyocaulus viviparus]|uniref:Uncharacterized protein n=1 Tax=Dictyocaulus viviparus TaxID=29172 RepID=A0A0D8X9G5_DICVI|nr:hypothetical protein DICVIV_13628 [Dictyocaulus viviparus]